MNSDQLIARMRYSAFIGDAAYYTEYTDARLLDELNDRLRGVFSDAIVKARSGYWLAEKVTTTTNGVVYIPPRAVTGGIESVALLYQGQYVPLEGVTPREADGYTTWSGYPRAYYVDSERIRILPKPSAAQTIRVRYYLRPSRLVPSQNATTGTSRGLVVSANPTTRAFSVNAIPYDQTLSVPAAITTGALVDVVRPSGWFSPVVVSEPCTISGTVVSLTGMSSAEFEAAVQVGHYLRAAEQTDWPAIPEDFHRLVADAGAAKILMEMGLQQKAEALSQSATSEWGRMRDLINPRAKSDPKQVRLRPYWARGWLW